MAFSDSSAELVLFGGSQAISEGCQPPAPDYLAETWIFDRPCASWTRVETQVAPPARGRHAAAFGGGAVWVFGGRFRAKGSSSGSYQIFNDLWRFDVATRIWSEVSVVGELPPARSNTSLVWDSKRHRLWLFGGNSSSSGASYRALSDVWSFDVQAASWTLHTPAAGPSDRLFHAATYDAASDAMVVFGGADETLFSPTAKYFSDLWSLDLESLAWTQLAAGITDKPAGRFWASLSAEPESGRYLLFGGHDDGALGNRNDLWTYDRQAGTWQTPAPGDSYQRPANAVCDFPVDFAAVDDQAPERRHAHAGVYAAACGELLVVGGKTDCGVVDDVWSYAESGWSEVRASTEGEACLRWRADTSLCSNLCN